MAEQEITSNSQVLTAREQEIFNLLLAGSIPKEIAYALNISYATVIDHQKNIYRKLNVNKINELLLKYSTAGSSPKNEYTIQETNAEFVSAAHEIKAFFPKWIEIYDDHGSYINFTSNIENVHDRVIKTYTIQGSIADKEYSYTGAAGFPDDPLLEIMRNAKSFSFTVLGDGNIYDVMFGTIEDENSDYNFYGKEFKTEKGVISTFNFKLDELSQSPFFFFQREPFNRDKINVFFIHSYCKGDYYLKLWDIKFYQ